MDNQKQLTKADKKGNFVADDYKELAFAEPARYISVSLQGAVPASISPSLEIRDNNLSGGQRNRLNVAQALIKDSPILILDEPTAGVDAAMSQNIVDYINKMKDEKTIGYITHSVDEIQDLQAYQALDLDKQPNEAIAHLTRYDLTETETKESYLDLFKNRKGSSERSESRVGKILREVSHMSYASYERLPKTLENTGRRERVARRLKEARREEMQACGNHRLVRDTYPKKLVYRNTGIADS